MLLLVDVAIMAPALIFRIVAPIVDANQAKKAVYKAKIRIVHIYYSQH